MSGLSSTIRIIVSLLVIGGVVSCGVVSGSLVIGGVVSCGLVICELVTGVSIISSGFRWSFPNGSWIVKVVPCPCSLSALMAP